MATSMKKKDPVRNSNNEGPGFTLKGYEILECIGKGTFGQVYKARHNETNEFVAIKKVERDRCGKLQGPNEANMEAEILEKLKGHPNVIFLKESIFPEGGGVCLVMEFMDTDLSKIVKLGTLTPYDIKHYMKQLLNGLAYCHEKKILHRDIKGANLLVSEDKILKLADFGLSRFLPDTESAMKFECETDLDMSFLVDGLSNEVITLAYRPLEILLGSTKYSHEVDVWSVGCVFGQLLNGGSLLFDGKDEEDQIKKIWLLCGSPNELNWPSVRELYFFEKFEKKLPHSERCLTDKYGGCFDADGLNLLDKMLALDPAKRITAADALEHKYFST